VREADSYFHEALENAWQEIRRNLETTRKIMGVREFVLETVSCSRDPYISDIDELPKEPKAARPDQLEVRVLVEAAYRVVR
jgi:hypothetical protein